MANISFTPASGTYAPGATIDFAISATVDRNRYERYFRMFTDYDDKHYPRYEIIYNGAVQETHDVYSSANSCSFRYTVPNANIGSFTVKVYFYVVYDDGDADIIQPSSSYTVQYYTNCYWDSGASSTLSASQTTAGTNVTLSWNTGQAHAGRNNPISAYYIYRHEYSSSSASWGEWVLCAQSTGSSCSVAAPTTVGNQYQFAVQIIGANGYNSTNYAYSGALTAKGTITNFYVTSITPTRTSAVIQWSQPTYNNTQPTFSYTCSVSGGSVAINGTSATVTGLTKGRSYNYTINASYDGVTATLTGSFSTKSVATVKYCADGNTFAEYEVWYCEDGTNFVSMDVYVSDGGPYYLCSF